MGQNYIDDLLILYTAVRRIGYDLCRATAMRAGFYRAAFGSMLNTLCNRCARVIAMDGMYAGFAGAKPGHRGVTFCGCAVICFTVFLALVALAAFCRCYQSTVRAIRTARSPGEHAVTSSPGANFDSFNRSAKQASIRDDTSKSGQSLPGLDPGLTLGFGTRAANMLVKV